MRPVVEDHDNTFCLEHSIFIPTGGYYVWVQLPAWVTPRPALSQCNPALDSFGSYAPPSDPKCADISMVYNQQTFDKSSLQWFIDKARTEFKIDFKLDIECFPLGPCVFYSPFIQNSTRGLPAQAIVSRELCGMGRRFVRMCFARFDEVGLEDAAERFVKLLAKVYAECNLPQALGGNSH